MSASTFSFFSKPEIRRRIGRGEIIRDLTRVMGAQREEENFDLAPAQPVKLD